MGGVETKYHARTTGPTAYAAKKEHDACILF